tara:strand:+ start:123 stop:440 length:318 start_codon:yes stop_codon:yes gene_type:complete
MKYRNKKRTKKIKIRLYILGIVAVFSFITLIFSDFGLKELFYLKQQKELLNNKIQTLYEQQISLQNEINNLSNDTDYVEKIAREKFLMVKPGEKVFRVIESKRDQ